MRRTERALIYVLAASVAGAALYIVFRPAPIQVEIATVTRGRFVAAIEEDGRTRVRDRYTISSPLAGRLLRPQLKAGDAVAADRVVATIVPSLPELLDPRTRSEAQERLGAAEAAVAETAAQIERLTRVRENADADLQRATTLRQSGTVTAQQLERAQLAALVAERELRAAEWRNHAAQHAVEQARTLLRWFDNPDPADRLEVRSPRFRTGSESAAGECDARERRGAAARGRRPDRSGGDRRCSDHGRGQNPARRAGDD